MRAMALTIFDRSFAITYALEAIAIIIGLVGVAATFSAQTLARTREFGMLRHIGVNRGQIGAMLAAEGALLGLVGGHRRAGAGRGDEPGADPCRQPAKLSLDDGYPPALGAVRRAGDRAGRCRGRHRAARRAAGAVGRCGARRAGRIGDAAARPAAVAACCSAGRAGLCPGAPRCAGRAAARPWRPPRFSHRMVVCHRLARHARWRQARLPDHLFPHPAAGRPAQPQRLCRANR